NLVEASFSELYHADGATAQNAYDKLGRMTAFQRGTLGDSDSLSGMAFDQVATGDQQRTQDWTLDALGNWDTVTNSSPTPRTHNKQNQITNSGFSYDGNGNLKKTTTGSTAPEYRYDAWNRMVEYKGSGSSFSASRYEYP